MRNRSYNAYFFILMATFGGKMAVATTRAPYSYGNSLGPPNPTKNLDHWVEFFGQPLSRNHVCKIDMSVFLFAC